MDDIIATFIDVTACDNKEAINKYLELADWDLLKAIDLFFDPSINVESGGGGASGGEAREPKAAVKTQEQLDEEFARQLANEDRMAQEFVPEARSDYMDTLHESNANHFQMDDTHQFKAFGADISEDPKGLKKLFAPPDYRFIGTFEAAQEDALQNERLLLASLNVHSDFRSHLLNRDIWKRDAIAGTIQSFFTFFQVEISTTSRLYSLYNVTDLPCVLAIDPRTGQKIKHFSFEELKTPCEASTSLLDFITSNPLSKYFKDSPVAIPLPMPSEGLKSSVAQEAPKLEFRKDTTTYVLPDRSKVDHAVHAPAPVPTPNSENSQTIDDQQGSAKVDVVPLGGQTLGSASGATAAKPSGNNMMAQLHAERLARQQKRSQG